MTVLNEFGMDFHIATRISSFENSFWMYLPDSIITVDVTHTGNLQSLHVALDTKS